jgi:hypothetical protein
VSSPIGNSGNPVADAYSLQLNTNFLATTACADSPNMACQGWEQFLFFNDGKSGSLYIQYWLLNYNTTCPRGWTQFSFTGSMDISCFRSSNAVAVPNQPITNLGELSLSGTFDAIGDSVTLSTGNTVYSAVGDNAVNAEAGWQVAEFNVFGAGGNSSGGGQASFNSGAAITIRTRVSYGSGVGAGILTTTPKMISVSGHYSNDDQRDMVIVGTTLGKIHEAFWKSGQQGIEGEDDLPVTLSRLVGVSSMFASDVQRHVVIGGTADGKIYGNLE